MPTGKNNLGSRWGGSILLFLEEEEEDKKRCRLGKCTKPTGIRLCRASITSPSRNLIEFDVVIPISDTSEREREKNTKKIRQKPNFCFVFLFAAAQWMYPPDWREQWKHGRKPFRSSSSAEDDVHWNLSALGFAFLLVDWSGGWASRVRDLSGIAFFFIIIFFVFFLGLFECLQVPWREMKKKRTFVCCCRSVYLNTRTRWLVGGDQITYDYG